MTQRLIDPLDRGSPVTIWIANPDVCWTGVDSVEAANGLVVSDNRIVELVPSGAEPTAACDQVFDASGLVVIPGLVNCHHHFYQTLTRAFPDAQNKELFDWLKALYPVWAGLDETGVYLSTQLALAELLLSGCTTAADHHYLFSENTGAAIDVQVSAAQQLGVRTLLTRGSMSLGTSAGGLPPDSVVQSEEEILDDSERLIRSYHQPAEDGMVQIALAPCSPFSVTPELMKASSVLARKYQVLLHTHLAETKDENQFCLERFGMRPLDYLDSVGWLDNDVWLAHGIHFNSEEIARMGAAGMAVCHCPSSNMILASGICPVKELETAAVTVGLGVDGSASNDHSNMVEEVRQAFLLQRLKYGSGEVKVEDALRWATTGGAKLLNRPQLGCLKEGAIADIAMFDPNQDLRFSGAYDQLSALVTSGASRAKHVMVNGVWRVLDGQIQGLDLDQLRAKHHEYALGLRG